MGGLVPLLVLGASLAGPLSGVVSASGAQGAPSFVRGTADASADTVGLKLVLGNAGVGFTLGRSLSAYQESFASADGRALDLEALPTLFGPASGCPGSRPLLPAGVLPPVTSVESTQADAGTPRPTTVFYPVLQGDGPAPNVAGVQDATATSQPSSTATTTNPTQDLGILTLENPRTETDTRLRGRVREATATVTADSLSIFGGLIRLVRPTWSATARSGDEQVTEGSFTFQSATLLGLPRGPGDARADLVNFAGSFSQLLGLLGARVDLPRVTVEDGSVKVSPLVFSFENLPLGRVVIGPLLDFFASSIDAFYKDLRASGCNGKSQAQLLQLLQGFLAGNGSLKLSLGGVAATTDDTYFPPLDNGAPTTAAPAPTAVAAPTAAAPAAIPAPPASVLGDRVDAGPAAPVATDPPIAGGGDGPETAAAPAAEPSTGSERGPTTAAAARPAAATRPSGGRGGTAATIGVVGLLAVVGMALADRRRILSGRRVIED